MLWLFPGGEVLNHALALVFLRVYKIPLGKSVGKMVIEKQESPHRWPHSHPHLAGLLYGTMLWASDRNVIKWSGCPVFSASHLTTICSPQEQGKAGAFSGMKRASSAGWRWRDRGVHRSFDQHKVMTSQNRYKCGPGFLIYSVLKLKKMVWLRWETQWR